MATIYALGSNSSGQLGIGHKEDVSVPKPVLFDSEPLGLVASQVYTKFKAGGNHTLIISSGSLWCSGDHKGGACGLTSFSSFLDSQFHPVCLDDDADSILSKSPVVYCAATWEASIIVQRDKNDQATRVYSFGIGNKGELAQGELLFRSSKPQHIKNFPPIGLEVMDLAASVSHVVAVLSNGDVYGWGSGRKGQLGQPEEIVYTPRKISGIDFKVVRAVCGREFTFLLGEATEGNFAVLGSDKSNVISNAPDKLPQWMQVGASWGSIFVLQHDGALISWGRDDHGQLTPPNLPPLFDIAIGSEHAVGLTLDGQVLAWGWGEHGNCGPSTENGNVKDRWNVIASSQYLPPDSKISCIGAGCATSWICIGS